MSKQQQTAKSVFLAAIELESAQEREDFVAAECDGNQMLAAEVRELIASQPRESYLESPVQPELIATVDAATQKAKLSRLVDAQIGPYRIRERIGEGGMGAVYVAEQERPLRRKVALKVIKPGMDSKAVLGRFDAERNALAMMNHPNIAKVLDAGTTGDGHPFFAMELVNGIPITEYCDEQKLSVQDRLKLFVDVCSAIHHAHQKGIIHRDIKPSNVLVTELDGKPIAKVIDFGVAKALNQSLTDHSVYTAFQAVIGTPLYMSPEQASFSAVDVDTRSDVYSLGVLLYELLTGTTPFTQEEFKKAAQDEVFKLIREQEPPRPSNRISSLGQTATRVSQLRRSQPQQLTRTVKGDLDWIVMKALSKERGRRYDSATRLSEDVERHLNSEIVEARPSTLTYQFVRFYLRNRLLIVSASVIAFALVGGLGVAIWGLQQSTDSARKLGENLLQEAVLAALSGDENRVESSIEALADTNKLSGDLDLLRALVAMVSDDLVNAEKFAQQASQKPCSLIGREKIGAQAIGFMAQYWSGQVASFELGGLEMQGKHPETSLDKLLLAYAILGNNPYAALDLVKAVNSELRRSAFGLLVQAQCRSLIAADQRAPQKALKAAEELSAVKFLLQDSGLAAKWELDCYTTAAELLSDGELRDFAVARGRAVLASMPRNSINCWHRWWFLNAVGDRASAKEVCRDFKSGCCFFVAADCLQALESTDIVNRYNALTVGQEEDSISLLARAHVLVGTSDARERIIDIAKPLLGNEAPVLRRHALAALCLVCNRDEIREFAKQHLHPKYLGLHDVWQGERAVHYYAGLEDQDSFSESSVGHGLTASNIFFTLGTEQLARGDRSKAIYYFKRCVNEGGILTFDYVLGKAYIERMEEDKNWPPSLAQTPK